jgi:AraC-like DNA-binding protein
VARERGAVRGYVERIADVLYDYRNALRKSAQFTVLEALFDRLPDVVFFVKDRSGRYVVVNETLRIRCGVAHKRALLGRRADEVFPPPLGGAYAAQDRLVAASGTAIEDRLELHLYPDGHRGWCLTYKRPLRKKGGPVTFVVGLSRDLHLPDEGHPEYRQLAAAVEVIRDHYDEPLRIEQLAREADLSVDRFERLVRRVFHLTPRQLLTKTRVDAASRLLANGTDTVADVAQACGYSDHSAFTRQFRAVAGMTPSAFRRAAAARGPARREPAGG